MKHRKNRVIVVLGMHRGGTSLIVRGLSALGVDIGNNFYPNTTDNPKGFWEDKDIHFINEKILSLFGMTWDSMRLIAAHEWKNPALDAIRIHASELLKRRFDNSQLWGFKDPRTARLLPFWQRVFRGLKISDSYVIAVRNPISVARSLAARDMFAAEKSYLLWLEHLLPSIAETSSKPRVVVDYDQLMNSPIPELNRIATALKITTDDSIFRKITEFASDFVTPDLRHSQYHLHDLDHDEAVSVACRSAFSWLSKLARDEMPIMSEELSHAWRGIESALLSLVPIYHYVDTLETSGKSSRQELDGTLAELERAQQARAAEQVEAQKQVKALTEWAQSADSYGKSSRQELDGTLAELERTQQARAAEQAEAQKQVKALTEWAESSESYAKSLAAALEEVKTERDATLTQVRELAEWRDAATSEWNRLSQGNLVTRFISWLRPYKKFSSLIDAPPDFIGKRSRK